MSPRLHFPQFPMSQFTFDCLTSRRLTSTERDLVVSGRVSPRLDSADGLITETAGSPSAWVDAWNSTTAPLVAIVGDSDVEFAEIARIIHAGISRLEESPSLAASLPSVREADLPDVWRDLTPQITPLCAPPDWRLGGVFRRASIEMAGGLRSVSDPFWDATLRILESDEGTDSRVTQVPTDAPIRQSNPPLVPSGISANDDWLKRHLLTLVPKFARRILSDPCDSAALQAGIWQFQGELDLSHKQSQAHEGEGESQLCDYWHAIMHRREPDYGNSKYWFRQVGRQPVFDELAPVVAKFLGTAEGAPISQWSSRLLPPRGWDPFAFVDLAEAAVGHPAIDAAARQIQWAEMLLLLRFTARPATRS